MASRRVSSLRIGLDLVTPRATGPPMSSSSSRATMTSPRLSKRRKLSRRPGHSARRPRHRQQASRRPAGTWSGQLSGLELLPPETLDETVTKVEMPPAPPQPVMVTPPQVQVDTLRNSRDAGASGAPRSSSVTAPIALLRREPQISQEYKDSLELAEQIDLVVNNVLTTFRKIRHGGGMAELEAGRPSVPQTSTRRY